MAGGGRGRFGYGDGELQRQGPADLLRDEIEEFFAGSGHEVIGDAVLVWLDDVLPIALEVNLTRRS